jgi:hypothetical protein
MTVKHIIRNQKFLFLKKLFILVVFLVIFDYIIGSLLQTLYFSQISGQNFRTTYALEKTKAEIIILGSSKATHHYIPQIFSETFNLSCYNAGRDGQHILFQYAILKGILKRYVPKIVILDVLPQQLVESSDNYNKLNALFPYYNEHEEIRPIVDSKSRMEKIKLLSKIYPYNSLLLTMIKSNIVKENDLNGYDPLEQQKNISKKSKIPNYETFCPIENLDQNMIIALESFIAETQKSGSKVYLVISPMYKHTKYPKLLEKLHQTAKKFNISLFDYSDYPEFETHPELFRDNLHMYKNGAELFSTIISQKLNIEYQNNQIDH